MGIFEMCKGNHSISIFIVFDLYQTLSNRCKGKDHLVQKLSFLAHPELHQSVGLEGRGRSVGFSRGLVSCHGVPR